MDSLQFEIVTSTRRCEEIVAKLLTETVIAMDAEGVHLGKDGPMTLLQIGTLKKEVFLFDVQENRSLFTDGRLAEALESQSLIKVIHSCSGDSAALFFQFNVRLRNVFDTQIAHLVIEESQGRRLASLMKLQMICQTYSKEAEVADNKEELTDLWTKEIGDFWAKRPLTADMIKYAAGDVIALLPEVYQTQKSLIEKLHCAEEFSKRVEEEILLEIDGGMRTQRQERVTQIVHDIIQKLDVKYRNDIKLSEIENEDDIRAVQRLDYQTAGLSPLVQRLKTESLMCKIKELNDQVDAEGDKLILNWRPHKFLHHLSKNHPNLEIRNSAKLLKERIDTIQLNDINRKYTISTPLNMVSKGDKEALFSMYPKTENDPRYTAVQLRLYWLTKMEEIETHHTKLFNNFREFTINEGYEKCLRYYTRGSVPAHIKSKAKSLLQDMDSQFGRGQAPRPRR